MKPHGEVSVKLSIDIGATGGYPRWKSKVLEAARDQAARELGALQYVERLRIRIDEIAAEHGVYPTVEEPTVDVDEPTVDVNEPVMPENEEESEEEEVKHLLLIALTVTIAGGLAIALALVL